MKVLIKTICMLLAALLLATSGMVAFATEPFTMAVKTNVTSANVGDVIQVSLVLKPGADISSMTIALVYDTDAFTYQNDMTTGDLLGDAPVDVSTNQPGKVTLAVMTTQNLNAGGELATASFRVDKPNGTLSLELITVTAADYDGTDVTEFGTVESATVFCAHGVGATEQITKQPTHTETGEKDLFCSACGEHIRTEIIPAQGHGFSAWTVAKPATCTEVGEEIRICTCGETETREIAMTQHEAGGWELISEPTCTEAGEMVQLCAVCGETLETETIPATGHTFGDWVVLREATQEQEGLRERICETCGEAEYEALPMLTTGATQPEQDTPNADTSSTADINTQQQTGSAEFEQNAQPDIPQTGTRTSAGALAAFVMLTAAVGVGLYGSKKKKQ